MAVLVDVRQAEYQMLSAADELLELTDNIETPLPRERTNAP